MEGTGEYRVIPYETAYAAAVRDLWEERFGAEPLHGRQRLFEWITSSNPFAEGESPYFLLLHEDRVIGTHGHMPLLFSVKGAKVRGYLAHDDLLDAHFRGKGLAGFLLRAVAEQVPPMAGALWFNEPNFRSYLKSGWLRVPEFFSYIKVLNPAFLAERLFGRHRWVELASSLGAKALRVREAYRRRGTSPVAGIGETESFDDRADAFFDRISSSFGIIVARNSRYLNWKFVDKPFNAYRRLTSFDAEGRLSGYMILKGEESEGVIRGRILDILADPEEPSTFRALLRKGVEECARISADFVEIVCTYPPFIDLLRKEGFIRARSPHRFMISNWEPSLAREFAGDIENWYITGSDADGDAWSVDEPDPLP